AGHHDLLLQRLTGDDLDDDRLAILQALQRGTGRGETVQVTEDHLVPTRRDALQEQHTLGRVVVALSVVAVRTELLAGLLTHEPDADADRRLAILADQGELGVAGLRRGLRQLERNVRVLALDHVDLDRVRRDVTGRNLAHADLVRPWRDTVEAVGAIIGGLTQGLRVSAFGGVPDTDAVDRVAFLVEHRRDDRSGGGCIREANVDRLTGRDGHGLLIGRQIALGRGRLADRVIARRHLLENEHAIAVDVTRRLAA